VAGSSATHGSAIPPALPSAHGRQTRTQNAPPPQSRRRPTCSVVRPVMNAMAYSPCRGCRMSTHSWNALVPPLPPELSGLRAALTCEGGVGWGGVGLGRVVALLPAAAPSREPALSVDATPSRPHLLCCCVEVLYQRHPLDEPLPQRQEPLPQPAGEEHARAGDEDDRSEEAQPKHLHPEKLLVEGLCAVGGGGGRVRGCGCVDGHLMVPHRDRCRGLSRP